MKTNGSRGTCFDSVVQQLEFQVAVGKTEIMETRLEVRNIWLWHSMGQVIGIFKVLGDFRDI